jgi:hypothetical protein
MQLDVPIIVGTSVREVMSVLGVSGGGFSNSRSRLKSETAFCLRKKVVRDLERAFR